MSRQKVQHIVLTAEDYMRTRPNGAQELSTRWVEVYQSSSRKDCEKWVSDRRWAERKYQRQPELYIIAGVESTPEETLNF